ncbi:PREDICTED: uncharacterized protein LOC104602976 [Nelumbo nucifera]|uniref:Uncharacterized protein LOC104602976 n=2 Tax=Nelumbo nucifera TaxID=4432 RepID=A0A1U8ACF7_NELNU|nr:PREDICTED: uncharacterized protein LOC104602976 [Nelumbo nucifera]DAD31761.1 TPA_asm: hypothetical protein HUJ06_010612 [Nelumbo nucifera]
MEHSKTTTAPTVTNKRVRDDSDNLESDSPEAKRIRDNLLDILNDTDTVVDRNPANQDLASVMKSFEEEISLPTSLPSETETDITPQSDSGESQPDLGYLLGASDDELGLPPTFSPSSGEEKSEEDILRVSSDAVGYDKFWGFEDEIPVYDSLCFGINDENSNNDSNNNNNSTGEFVALGGLFDYPDVFSGSSDYSDFSWRPESLPAL